MAIAKGDMDETLCGGTDDGVVIFDNPVRRTVEYGQGQASSIKSIAWGSDATTLYGEDWNNVYALTVDANGANSPRALFPYRVGTTVYDLGRDLRFDQGTNRLYNSFGNVFDTRANAELTPIRLVDAPAIVNACGTPYGTVCFIPGANE